MSILGFSCLILSTWQGAFVYVPLLGFHKVPLIAILRLLGIGLEKYLTIQLVSSPNK